MNMMYGVEDSKAYKKSYNYLEVVLLSDEKLRMLREIKRMLWRIVQKDHKVPLMISIPEQFAR